MLERLFESLLEISFLLLFNTAGEYSQPGPDFYKRQIFKRVFFIYLFIAVVDLKVLMIKFQYLCEAKGFFDGRSLEVLIRHFNFLNTLNLMGQTTSCFAT